MKKRSIIITSLSILVSSLAIGASVSLAAFASSKKQVIQTGIANTGGHGTLIFFEPGTWEIDNAEFYIYSWAAGKPDLWMKATTVTSDQGYYVYELDTLTYTNIIFARMNPAKNTLADFANNDYWNKTSDLSYSAPNNLYSITGWGTAGVSTGTWSTYADS